MAISSAVIYLDRCQYRADDGEFHAGDGAGTECTFRYRVVLLWEVDAETFLREVGPGLAPFAALMKTSDPIRTVVQCKQRILEGIPQSSASRTLPDARKAELCGVLFALAGLVIEDRELLFKLLWEDWMGLERSVTVQWLLERGMERGMERGLERGTQQGTRLGLLGGKRDDVITVLQTRFGEIPESIASQVRAIEDTVRLTRLLQEAVRARSIEEFAAALEGGSSA